MVVGLDLHQLLELILLERIGVGLRIDRKDVRLEAGDDGRVVLVRRKRVLRTLRVRVLDHLEKRILLLLAVDDELGAEDLVTAMLGVDLTEHHEFGVRRIAARRGEALRQILHLGLGNRQANLNVGLANRLDALPKNVIRATRLGLGDGKEIGQVTIDALGHLVVKRRIGNSRKRLGNTVANAALDTQNRLETTVAEDVRRLRGPRGNRALARRHKEVRPITGPVRVQQRRRTLELRSRGATLRLLNRIDPTGVNRHRTQGRIKLRDRIVDGIQTERRIGGGTNKQNHASFLLNQAVCEAVLKVKIYYSKKSPR